MRPAAARPSPSRTAFAFDQLPNEAQSLVCSLACTPSCPAHLLLARVSKTWGAAAAPHFSSYLAEGKLCIELELICTPDSPFQQRQREVQRLESLAQWLQQYGHLLKQLAIPVQYPSMESEYRSYELEAAPVIPDVMAALVAAGQQPGGLQLQQLEVPVLGGTPMPTICKTLSACPQLRELHLDNNFGGVYTTASWSVMMELPAALQQLTQLTWLRLEGNLFKYNSDQYQHHGPDDLLRSLPTSLVVLELSSKRTGYGVMHMDMSSSSLQHLVSLKQLTLPEAVGYIDRNAQGGGAGGSLNNLTALTALTYLECDAAGCCLGGALLAAPNLVEVRAGDAGLAQLNVLAGRPALRSLHVILDVWDGDDYSPALRALTQLTGLRVLMEEEHTRPGPEEVGWDFEGESRDGLVEGKLQDWCPAVASLTGLRWLGVSAEMLLQLDLAALTALTRLSVDCHERYGSVWYKTNVLHELAAAGGQLLEVEVEGLDGGRGECRAAVTAALGDKVVVSFT